LNMNCNLIFYIHVFTSFNGLVVVVVHGNVKFSSPFVIIVFAWGYKVLQWWSSPSGSGYWCCWEVVFQPFFNIFSFLITYNLIMWSLSHFDIFFMSWKEN
jgi:hypothetical protein